MKKFQNETKIFSDIELIGNEMIVQSESLAGSFKQMKLSELKFFSFLISKLNPSKPDNLRFRVKANVFAKAIGRKSTSGIYVDIPPIIKNLTEKVITIYPLENEQPIEISPLSYAKYHTGEGFADVEISPHLASYMFDPREEFVQYKLSNIMHMDSAYAVRMYEILKKHGVGTRTFYICSLKEGLGISDKFKSYNNFQINVLDIAQREINQKTNILISYTPRKAGRKIIAIEFNIKSKKQKGKHKNTFTQTTKWKKNIKYEEKKLEPSKDIIPNKYYKNYKTMVQGLAERLSSVFKKNG